MCGCLQVENEVLLLKSVIVLLILISSQRLELFWQMGVVNRDIKLENTLLNGDRRALLKICDFGYSKNEKDSLPKSRVGTPGYTGTSPFSIKYFRGPLVVFVPEHGISDILAEHNKKYRLQNKAVPAAITSCLYNRASCEKPSHCWWHNCSF